MYIRVHVVAGARRERIVKIGESEWQMTVREPATRNLANQRIKEILAENYVISTKHVRLITGYHSPTKIFDVEVEDRHISTSNFS